jgi:hypothetical protein
VNIPGATNETFAIGSLQGTESGSYSVVVADEEELSAITHDIAVLVVDVPPLAPADRFADRTVLPGGSGLVGSSNATATKETGEPNHGGKPGGRSVWYRWVPPASGIATIQTSGSAFDTLLGVYTGNQVTTLVTVAQDEDSGGFLTSQVRFNVEAGTEYQIALDGFAGVGGLFVLTWDLWETTLRLPVVVQPPSGLVVSPGSTAVFQVEATGEELRYQWLRNGEVILGVTDPVLTLDNVGADEVGAYEVVVTGAGSLSVQTPPAYLDLGTMGTTLSQDKLEDLLTELVAPIQAAGFVSVSLGSVGNQWLHNFASTTQENEPNHAGAIGGASRWLGIEPTEAGILAVDTMGSQGESFVAVYTGLELWSLTALAQAHDRQGSLVRVPVQAGQPYLVAVDTPRGAEARLQVNWGLGVAPVFTNSMVQWTGTVGDALELEAGVSPGTGQVSYQWLLEGESIAGATHATYRVEQVSWADAGRYDLVVSNWFGLLTNGVAQVAVEAAVRLEARMELVEGGRELRLMGSGGEGTVLEISSDLRSWEPVWTNSLTEPVWEYVAPVPLFHPQGFYRARSGP